MFRYKSISVTCLLVTILLGNVEQQLITLSCSIEKYQEIGPWTLWLALGSFSVNISRSQ